MDHNLSLSSIVIVAIGKFWSHNGILAFKYNWNTIEPRLKVMLHGTIRNDDF